MIPFAGVENFFELPTGIPCRIATACSMVTAWKIIGLEDEERRGEYAIQHPSCAAEAESDKTPK
jgi:hypothetical protein